MGLDMLWTGASGLPNPVEFILDPKFSSWGKEVLCQVVDVDPITALGNFKNG